MAIFEAEKEMIWLKSFLKELSHEQDSSSLFTDSQSGIHLAKNPIFHSRTKHIQLRYHHIHRLIDDGTLLLKKIAGEDNHADMLTKVMTVKKLRLCIISVGLQD
nr:Ty1/Copia family ribonuclease HI [Serratia marcescens]